MLIARKNFLIPPMVAVFQGFFAANAVGDDIEVYTDDSREAVAATLYGLRQQCQHEEFEDGPPGEAAAALDRRGNPPSNVHHI